MRPTRAAAAAAVDAFLLEIAADPTRLPSYTLIEDGEDCWAFFILKDDTTSYVHDDLKIEWAGTMWMPGDEDEDE